MRFGIVNDHFSLGPGGQHRIQNLALGLSKLGHEVLYMSPYGVSSDIFDLDVSNVSSYKSSAPSKYLYPYVNDFFRILKRLSKLNRKLDLLLIELPNTMSKSLNAIYGILRNVPTSYDFGGLWTSILDRGKTYHLEKHGFRVFRPAAQFLEDILAQMSARLPDLVTVPTTGMKTILEKFLRVKAQVLLQPIDTREAFNPKLVDPIKAQLLLPEKYLREQIVMLGVKGDAWFVPWVEKLSHEIDFSDVTFLILGSFPMAREMCIRKGLDEHVYFTGVVPNHVVPYYVSICKFALVLTPPPLKSIWYAPHNIVKIAEYMAMGKPIITDTLAAADYVFDGQTGFLTRNEEDLLEKTALLLQDQKLARKMGEVARKTACEMLDQEKVAIRFIELFRKHFE